MDEEIIENDAATCAIKASSIQAIDKKSVHRICSGQVVLTLATAVKELVENSIDAGATSVEVKVKDYGSECIEVIDNGSGVKDENFEGLTLKHHTSKLTDFNDLVNVSTFGFRGEALSSLCALSNMVILTRHKSVSVGTRLEFDLNGKILSRKPTPKPVGTIVIVQNIFHSLPVRHKEFQRNLKKEFARLIQVLHAYCIINTGVRISCMNQTTNGKRTTVISTNCNTSMRDNISNVFGSKQIQSLLEFKQSDPKDEICSEYGVKILENSPSFSICGFVSKCEHGQGRSSGDRQFLFINKRPCDASKILKLINEVYHLYNRHQYPFVSLSIEMNKESVDVNVTPDKRQIFLEGEKLLLAVLKTSLIKLFEPTSSVFKVNNILTPNPLNDRSSFLKSMSSPLPQRSVDKSSSLDSISKLKRRFSSTFDKSKDSPLTASPSSSNSNNKSKKMFTLSSFASSYKKHDDESSPKVGAITNYFTPICEKKCYNDPIKKDEPIAGSVTLNGTSEDNNNHQTGMKVEINHVLEKEDNLNDSVEQENNHPVKGVSKVEELVEESRKTPLIFIEHETLGQPTENVKDFEMVESIENESRGKCDMIDEDIVCEEDEGGAKCELIDGKDKSGEKCEMGDIVCGEGAVHSWTDQDVSKIAMSSNVGNEVLLSNEICHEQTEMELMKHNRKEIIVKFSLKDLRNKLKKTAYQNESTSSFSRSFRAKISPGDNKSAEEELQKEISKDMFSKMEIIGQFNLGFIITRLGNDLFIVDQHATDEKYNFEMLQRNHVLQSQKMIIPQNLELCSSNEIILLDNLDVFKKNGFDFLIQPEALPTQRVKLVSAPVSKNWRFGKDDIEELLFMLMDSPNVMCRPTRVRLMFASRACRKSIMIGTALNHSEMKRLVTHMGEIEQPWNCPHGRPTMRHLFNLDMLPS